MVSTILLCSCATPEPEHVVGANWVGPADTPLGKEYTPARARRWDTEGLAIVQCLADGEQKPNDCKVIYEWPQDFGFGEAALKLTAKLMVSTTKGYDGHVLATGEPFINPVFFCPAARDAECRLEMKEKVKELITPKK